MKNKARQLTASARQVIQHLRFGSLVFRVQGLGFRVLGFRVKGLGLGFRVY
jgi:hypothetical protein